MNRCIDNMTQDTGLDEMLLRMKDVIKSEGASSVNLLRLDEVMNDTESLAIFQFNHTEMAEIVEKTDLDPSLIFPMTIKVSKKDGDIKLEVDRFYQKAGEIQVEDPKVVQDLLLRVDQLVDRIIKKL